MGRTAEAQARIPERGGSCEPPPPDVLRAFGATEAPVLMPGGEGRTYRSGDVVLKPVDDETEAHGLAAIYGSMVPRAFRVPRPIRTRRGAFTHGGWHAWAYLEGHTVAGHWREIIEVCVRFHEALAHLPRPTFLDLRAENPWIVADQVAFGEREIVHHPRVAPVVERLQAVLCPVPARSQLIHGDFGGNVLFHEGLTPAVIDWAPYWRPVPFAVGVIVADAIVWEGADESLISAGSRYADFDQFLARAELRRVIEIEPIHAMYGCDALDQIDAHTPLVGMIEARCR